MVAEVQMQRGAFLELVQQISILATSVGHSQPAACCHQEGCKEQAVPCSSCCHDSDAIVGLLVKVCEQSMLPGAMISPQGVKNSSWPWQGS